MQRRVSLSRLPAQSRRNLLRHRLPHWGSLLALILLLSGCTSGDLARLLATRTAQTPSASTIDPQLASSNRLLVHGLDGNLFTINPDGTLPFALTTDAGRDRSYSQATWSSSGEQIGWVGLAQTSDGIQSSLNTSRADGSARAEIDTLFAPFYLYWSPDDSKIAYLSNWVGEQAQTIALMVADVTDATEDPVTIDIGQPLYFSWSPTSDQLLTHAANQRVALITVASGDEVILDETIPNTAVPQFAAPQWGKATNQLLFVTNEENIPSLILTDANGENAQFVTNFSQTDTISFSLNPPGTRVAYIETSAQIGFNAFGPLLLYDLPANQFTQLSDGPVVAFFWSPDGEALFFLSAEATEDRAWLRVNIWDGERVQQYDRFAPSPIFLRDYLRFADQYMQSVRLWSPDSRAIVYAGEHEDGTAGVWVQSVGDDSPAQLVAEGVFATWSPR